MYTNQIQNEDESNVRSHSPAPYAVLKFSMDVLFEKENIS
jgi:hypothetical protein